MKRINYYFTVIILLCVFLAGCSQAVDFIPDRQQPEVFNVTVTVSAHGSVRAIPDKGQQGTEIFLLVNPEPNYRLADRGLIIDNNTTIERFDMPARNVRILSEFVPVPAGNYTVTIGSISNGYVTVNPQYGPPDTIVTVTPVPDAGYDGPVFVNGAIVNNYQFLLSSGNVTITADFTSKSAIDLLESGKKALAAGKYDNAVKFFEAAWQKEPGSPEIAFYASLTGLAKIAVDTNVRNFIKTRIGISRIPANLDELLSTTWMRPYRDRDDLTKDPVYLPSMSSPPGFQNNYLWQNTIDGSAQPTQTTFRILLWVDFLYRNPDGYNEYLEEALLYIFGNAFKDAESRAESLKYEDRIVLDNPNIIKNLYLEGLVAPGETVGRAELDALFGSLRMAKAALEYLSAYDWNTDTRLFPWDTSRPFDEIMDECLARLSDRMYNQDINLIEWILPFKNFFLTDRKNNIMGKAKNDFINAANTLNNAWAYYHGGNAVPDGLKNKLNNYQWFGDGIAKLITALKNGDVFYFSPEMPQGNLWFSPTEAKYGVNTAKFFQEGQFELKKLFVLESGGRSPSLFGFPAGNTVQGTVISVKDQISQYGGFGFQINMVPITGVFVKGFENYSEKEWLHNLFSGLIMYRQRYAESLYDYYHRR